MRVIARVTSVAAGALALAAIGSAGIGQPGASAQSVQSAQSAKSSKVAAADRTTVTMQYGGWKVTCDDAGDQSEQVCSADFRVIDKERNATILTWRLGRSSDDRLLSEFFVPTEVLIEPGVGVRLEDGPAYKADYVACGKSACKAILPLDAALASELASATQATVSLTASNGKVTRFSMGIAGIESALAELGN